MEKEILIVDDEPLIARMIEAVLRMNGYARLMVFSEAPAALEYFMAHADQVGVLLLDWKMPELNGLAFAARARAARPDIPIVMVTAFDARAAADGESLDMERARFIPKPFAPTQLLTAVTEWLPAPVASGKK